MYTRLQKFMGRNNESVFLWGARRTGKSTLLKQLFPHALYYDLLLSDEYGRFLKHSAFLREEILVLDKHTKNPVIIDEIQRLPELLNEAYWLIGSCYKY